MNGIEVDWQRVDDYKEDLQSGTLYYVYREDTGEVLLGVFNTSLSTFYGFDGSLTGHISPAEQITHYFLVTALPFIFADPPVEPKPCPFCGGKNIYYDGILAKMYCDCCEASTRRTDNKKQAMGAWNKRAGE